MVNISDISVTDISSKLPPDHYDLLQNVTDSAVVMDWNFMELAVALNYNLLSTAESFIWSKSGTVFSSVLFQFSTATSAQKAQAFHIKKIFDHLMVHLIYSPALIFLDLVKLSHPTEQKLLL